MNWLPINPRQTGGEVCSGEEKVGEGKFGPILERKVQLGIKREGEVGGCFLG